MSEKRVIKKFRLKWRFHYEKRTRRNIKMKQITPVMSEIHLLYQRKLGRKFGSLTQSLCQQVMFTIAKLAK